MTIVLHWAIHIQVAKCFYCYFDLQGKNAALNYISALTFEPFIEQFVRVPLKPGDGWVNADTGLSATKGNFIDILGSLTVLLIRGPYNKNANSIFRYVIVINLSISPIFIFLSFLL